MVMVGIFGLVTAISINAQTVISPGNGQGNGIGQDNNGENENSARPGKGNKGAGARALANIRNLGIVPSPPRPPKAKPTQPNLNLLEKLYRLKIRLEVLSL